MTWVVLIALALLIACAITFGNDSPIDQKVESELGLDVEATDAKKLPGIAVGGDLVDNESEDINTGDGKKKADGAKPPTP